MRSRFAAVAILGLAICTIAATPPADASAQQNVEQTQEITADSGHASFPLENLRFIDIAVKGASVVRVIKADSAGVPLLVVLVKRLPNPAAPLAIAPNCGGQPGTRSASGVLTPPNTSGLPAFATRNLVPLQALLPERSTVERLSSGLRAPAAIGTLITSRRLRLSRHYKIS